LQNFNDKIDKNALRRHFRELLHGGGYGGADATEAVLESIRRLPLWKSCHGVVGYCAIGHEVPVMPLLEEYLRTGCGQLYLPRYNAEERCYDLVMVSSLERDLSIGHYGILEPRGELPATAALEVPTLWLVPGIAFSENCDRLGRGGGYYDRLLAKFAGGVAVGVAWELQLCRQLPVSVLDCPMSLVVTEKNIYPAVR